MSFIQVTAFGNITRDPEVRYLPNGTAVCEFGIAATHKYKSQSGEQKEDTCFLDVTAWGKRGEVIKQYFQKGSPILVQGRLRLETWEDKTTQQKRSRHTLQMENFEFVGGKREGGGGSSSGGSNAPSGQAGGQQQQPPPVDDSDDIPF